MTKDDGGPFHPCKWTDHDLMLKLREEIGLLQARDAATFISPGASFRAVAAMHAMVGILVSKPNGEFSDEELASSAVDLADALIAELKK